MLESSTFEKLVFDPGGRERGPERDLKTRLSTNPSQNLT